MSTWLIFSLVVWAILSMIVVLWLAIAHSFYNRMKEKNEQLTKQIQRLIYETKND